jgi:hypothetical protein
MAVVDDVVQDDAAPGMDSACHLRHGAERGDDNGHLVLGAHHQILLQPLVRPVDDLVDGEGCGFGVRIVAVMRGQCLRDLVQPFIQLGGRPRIQRRKRADHACLALGNDKRRIGNDEQRGGERRHAEAAFKHRGQGHAFSGGFQAGCRYPGSSCSNVYANVNHLTEFPCECKSIVLNPEGA